MRNSLLQGARTIWLAGFEMLLEDCVEERKYPPVLVEHHAKLRKEAVPSWSRAATAPKCLLQAVVLPL